ncbi:YqcI/YcgG family protein [Terribacillus sp. DMT04]|uniref:YqcI/YcgG family protein n=1 Tax=Terribacillus sp. DMT04 TaxID=2850441 RepID=UPI001C2B8DA0|nr:YqcI/YcgG family protein [Terribacillus sp. DMT04]QXE00214.1 YqcI/YcgG family protein [Terribacillus sp. DMT04]
MTTLFDIHNSDYHELTLWQQDMLQSFHSKLSDQESKFPCIPATAGHALDQFRYGFADDPTTEDAAKQLAGLLEAYGKSARELGSYTSLIVFFDTAKQQALQLDVPAYFQIFWELLSKATAYDTNDWPDQIPEDPKEILWEYCFGEEKYFMYCATPSHIVKKSRNFPCMMLAITPRWVLEEFQSKPKPAAAIKNKIRQRIRAYDSNDVHPDLNAYGNKDNLEWKQYFLHDDNSSPAQCPFHRRKQN